MVDELERLKRSLGSRYAVEREVGRGGMATVYLAYDPKLGRQVAVKVLRPTLASTVAVERFEREIRIAARLTHPRILPVHEAGQADGLLYYVMPYVEGESLRARLDREKQLPVPDALRIAREVAEALGYAHAEGVVHRDIKPANILLTSGGAVVTDFGVARAVSRVSGEGITVTGLAVGTPGYMSPEQATGEEEVDGRSDLYSLGCVLYEMLVGEPPFTGRTPQLILARQLGADPSPASTVRPTLTGSIDDLFARALARTPADRYQTGSSFIEALREFEGERGATPPGARVGRAGDGREVRVPLRPMGVLASLAALVVVAVVVAWLWRATGDGAAPPGASEARPDPTRIAILPFDLGNEDGALGTLARNLHERLVAALGGIEPLTVLAGPEDGGAWADVPGERRVGTIVRPTIASFADSLEVRLMLEDGATKEVEVVGTVRAPRSDRIRLVDEVADTLTSLLRRQLGRSIRHRRALVETESREAFDRVLAASEHLETFLALLDDADFEAAARELDQAEANLIAAERADPGWVEPIVRRGRLTQYRYLLARTPRALPGDATEWLDRGLEHADRALRRNPDDPDARELRGTMLLQLAAVTRMSDSAGAARMLREAEDEFRAALQNARVASRPLRQLGEVLARQGRYEAALTYLRRAYDQDPFLENRAETLRRLFDVSVELGRDSAAAAWCDRGRRTGEKRYMFLDCRLELMAWSDVYDPDPEAAWALVDTLFSVYPRGLSPMLEPRLWDMVAVVLARAGLADSALRVLERARAADPTGATSILPELAVLHHSGRTDRALDRLAEYRETHPSAWQGLRDDRRLRALGLAEPLESGPP